MTGDNMKKKRSHFLRLFSISEKTAILFIAAIGIVILSPKIWALASGDNQMIYIQYKFVSPEIRPGSFEAAPRKIWRLGDHYLRIEEAPDPDKKIFGLAIINEPDSWLINRYNKTVRHIVDPGPTFFVHFPVLLNEQTENLKELELGHELDFFGKKGAKIFPTQIIDGVSCKPYRLEIDNREIVLFVGTESNKPVQINVRKNNGSYSIRYLEYRDNLPPDLNLFALPNGLTILKEKQ
jgi:hypothetical protein